MGLDMYLSKRTYVKKWEHQKKEATFDVRVSRGGKIFKGIDPEKVSYVEEEIGYWRKSNQIHNWFVANVQSGTDDCGEYYVSEDNLEDLLKICNTILDKCKLEKTGKKETVSVLGKNGLEEEERDELAMTNPEVAEKLLPTQEGFFFGSTSYDSYYYDDIEATKEILEEALKSGGDFQYHSSW